MKIRQTSLFQTGAAGVIVKGEEKLVPLFTEDVVKELHNFMESTGIKNYTKLLKFFKPTEKVLRKFSLKENDMKVIRTGVMDYYQSPILCKCNDEDFPSYFN